MSDPKIRVIDGCGHQVERMTEWADNGACPICLTAEIGLATQRLERLSRAATALYEAGHWHCDRPVDEIALWTELRDALGREPGGAPKPLTVLHGQEKA